MSNEQDYGHDYEGNEGQRFQHKSRNTAAKRTRPATKRPGKGPQSVNGIHKRRRRKMAW